MAYTVQTSSLKEDKSETQVWMAPTDGGAPLPMTARGTSASHPRFSPDGRYLGFLAARPDEGEDKDDAKTQVWLLDRRGGEAQRLTEVLQGVESFEWSPDGKRLVLLIKDPTPEELEAQKHKDAGTKPVREKAPRVSVVDRQQIKRDYEGYLDRRRTHLHVFDVEGKKLAQVTSGDHDDAQPAWSPDGRFLAFVSNRTEDQDTNYDSNVWVVAADNPDKGRTLVQLTTNPGEDEEPAWSPDGKWIAYVTNPEPKLLWYATRHLALLPAPAAGGAKAEPKLLTKPLDRNVRSPQFAPDSASLYFRLEDSGEEHLARIPVAGGAVTRPIGGPRAVARFAVGKDGTIAALVSEPTLPDEVFLLKGGAVKQLTYANKEVLDGLRLSDYEEVQFKSPDGTTVEGFVVKPPGFSPELRYPALLRIHGGPVAQYDRGFTFEDQLFAANGYVVLLPNPRGSSGYGQDFSRAIFADWGNKDTQDVLAQVDYAVAQGYVDPEPPRRGRLVVRRHPHQLRDQPDRPLQGRHLRRRRRAVGRLLRPRPLPARIRGGAGPALEEPRGVGAAVVAVLQRGEDHHAHALHGRRRGLERAHHRLGADVPGAAPPGPQDAARRVPRPAPRHPQADLPEGPLRAVPGLVRQIRQGRGRQDGVALASKSR